MIWRVVSVLALLSRIAALDVSLYEGVNKTGLILKASNVTNCTELLYGHHLAQSVDTHGGCATLYSERECKGQLLTALPDAPINNDLAAWNFSNKAQSLSPCDSDRDTSVYFGNENELVYQTVPVEDMCNCLNLPAYARKKNITVATTYGLCIQLFSDIDCKGTPLKLKPGDAVTIGAVIVPSQPSKTQYEVDILHFLGKSSIVSIGPCDLPTNCTQISATIMEFKYPEDLNALLNPDKTKKVDILTRSKIINNSTGTLTQTFRQSKSVAEEYEVSHIATSTKIKKWSVSSTAGTESSADLFGLFSAKITVSVTAGGGEENSESTTDSEKNSTKSEKVYTVDKTVSVSPCSIVEVGSSATYVDKMLVPFQIIIRFQGTIGDRQMTTAELSTSLPIAIEAERAIDDRTIEGSVNGSVRASMGLDMLFYANERKLDGCTGTSPHPQSLLKSLAPNIIASPKLYWKVLASLSIFSGCLQLTAI